MSPSRQRSQSARPRSPLAERAAAQPDLAVAIGIPPVDKRDPDLGLRPPSRQDLLVTLGRDPGLLARIVCPRRIELPVPEVLADDPKPGRVLLELEPGADVPNWSQVILTTMYRCARFAR